MELTRDGESLTRLREAVKERLDGIPVQTTPVLEPPYSSVRISWRENRANMAVVRLQDSERNVKLQPLLFERDDNNSHRMCRLYRNNKVVDSAPCTLLPVVPGLPGRAIWCPIETNVMSDEGQQQHTNIPYLGDEVIEKEATFIAALAEEVSSSCQAIGLEDAVLAQLIDSLSADLPPVAASTFKSSTGEKEMMTYQQLRDKFPFLPPLAVFQGIEAAYPEWGSTALELLNRYIRFRTTAAAAASNADSLVPDIDDPNVAQSLSAEQSLNTYNTLFCSRCYVADCPLHKDNPQVDGPIPRPYNEDDDLPLPSEPCSTACYMLLPEARSLLSPRTPWPLKLKEKHQNLYRVEESAAFARVIGVANRQDFSFWTAAEKSLFRIHIKTFPGNFCAVSQLIASKTCGEVFRFSRKEGKTARVRRLARHNGAKGTKNSRKRQGHLYKSTENGVKENKKTYIPCHHPGEACHPEVCECRANNNYCEKFCYCTVDCLNRFPGCRCKASCTTKACPCFLASRECDTDLCRSCLDGRLKDDPAWEAERNPCRNVALQRKEEKLLLEAPSDVAGWGCFIGEDVEKGEFIAEYVGEIISQEEVERRARVYDRVKSSYIFSLNEDYAVDAARMGGKIRFANHSSEPNCKVKILIVNGDQRIGIYAKRMIKKGEELFFDYGKDFKGHDLI